MTQQDFQPGDFLRCPKCRRSTTVELTMHLDGDVSIHCEACDAHASAYPLNQHTRVYDYEGQYSL